jgi:glyoxylase-like metal-dependent hydrolase (beta-lactamase superfamily II)
MNKVKVLIEGYAHKGKDGSYIASPTTTLIETNNKKILVDPGVSPELINKLDKEGLKTFDIDIVYLSHYHPDHFLNIRLFPNHDIYDGEVRWSEDKEYFHKKYIPDTDIEILLTPGHSAEHTSLLIKTEDKGVVCVAADVFWWEDGKQKSDKVSDLINLKDPFASDIDALIKSRKLILKMAEWIIPGHGKMFKNPSKN